MTRQKGKYGGRQTKVRRRDRDEATLKEIDYTKLKRKLRIMNNDRRNYAHEVNHILRKQGKELEGLEVENKQMAEDLTVAYGSYHLNRDVDNTASIKELLGAREDYDRLTNIEVTSCKELDVKINSLREQLNDYKREAGGEEAEQNRRINRKRYNAKLEDKVNKLETEFNTLLHDNDAKKKKIEIYAKEKKIYQDLYDRITQKIGSYKKKILDVTREASGHYEQRLEAMAKMKTLRERSSKDESTFQAEMKILQRMIAHDFKLKEFMTTKENERLNYKAEEAEKRAKMSVKEKALIDESQHVRKFEDLFQNVRSVTGHEDLERVVNEFTAKDEENFARFDYVSELNHEVEKLRDDIQKIKDNIKRVREEDALILTGNEKTINDLKTQRKNFQRDVDVEELKLSDVSEKLESVAGAVHVLFRRISCSTDTFKMTLAFEDHVTDTNLKVYLSLIEQRCMELICILKFIGLHQDHHGNLLKSPRSSHRIRPRGPSKILLTGVDQPMMPSINTPNITEDAADADVDETSLPMDIEQLRDRAMKKIAKKEAAGLLNQPLFVQDKRGKPKTLKPLNKGK